MNRKLASIQRIRSVGPIEGADNIQKAVILGWELVVKKGEFQPGDLCIYMEIDSLLPERPEFEFLRPRGFRIRTVRLRKQISQGIAFPLSILPETSSATIEGTDVTEILGVKKYEPPIPESLSGQVKGTFPAFLKGTDETRIQAFPDVAVRHKGTVFYITEKLDGTSMTVYLRDGEFGVCSRNLDLLETPGNKLWRVARELGLEEKLRGLGNYAFQGELIGPGIQKNKYGLAKEGFYIFNVFDIDRYRYLPFEDFRRLVKASGLDTVPIVVENHRLQEDIPALVRLAGGTSRLNAQTAREGIVFRSLEEQDDPDLGRLSFKVINPEFLLRYDE